MDSLLPGFITLDILPQHNVRQADIKYFYNKVISVRSLRKARPFLPILLALSYTPDALSLCRKNGILATTPKNLFGGDVDVLLKDILNVLTDMTAHVLSKDTSVLGRILKGISSIERRFNNLRGQLFELLVGHIVYSLYAPYFEVDKRIATKDGEAAEIDLYCLRGQKDIYIIECKAITGNTLIDIKRIEEWLRKISIVYKWLREHEDNSSKTIQFEFWTTSDFCCDALELLKQKQANIGKYRIEWKNGYEVLRVCHDRNLTSMANILREQYNLVL